MEKAVKREVVDVHHQKREQRVNAVLELKTNTEHALAELRGQNEKRLLQMKSEKSRQDQEFEGLISEGKNPYEVFRRRQVQKRAEKKLRLQQEKIKRAEMDIARKMISDDTRVRAKEAVERHHKQYVDKYQSELGRKAKEDRVRQYMISKTSNHAELVDPTGRVFRIEPSQVTDIKDNSFGLGKSANKSIMQRNAVIDSIKSKATHRGVEPIARFIPKQIPKPQSEDFATNAHWDEDEGFETLAAIPASSSTSDVKHKPRIRQSGKGKSSVLEKRMMQEALARQKDNMIEKQIVWGKEFTGTPFLSSPSVIWFKDFTVNQSETITFDLTNVSNTFNHFRVLSLSDRIKDFFEISYEKPGRMSAGMTCKLSITFLPKVRSELREFCCRRITHKISSTRILKQIFP